MMTPAQTTAFYVAVMFMVVLLMYRMRNPGYRCPACGTSNAREHSEDCSWSRFYGDDD